MAEARDRVVMAATLTIFADALVAAIATWRAHGGLGASFLAWFESAAFLTLPVVLLAIPVDILLRRREVRLLGTLFNDGLAGQRPENRKIALLLFATCVAGGTLLGTRLGVRIFEHESARVTVMLTLAFCLFSILASAILVAIATRFVTRALSPLSRRMRWFPARLFLNLSLAGVGVATVFTLLPTTYAITPTAALAGFALAPFVAALETARGEREEKHRGRGARWFAMPLAALVMAGAGVYALPRLGGVVQLAVLYRAPYTSLVLAAARAGVDRDHDGYSPILLGGDCDDHDAAVHPGAFDRPGDGVDENCSGSDSHPYVPAMPRTPPPARTLPPHMNIVMVQMDALRPDHVHFTGYKRPTSPRLDRLREQSTWFSNVYTPAPTTRLAMASIFTGLEIERIPQHRGPGVDFVLLPEATTLAERLEGLGYDRVGFTISYVVQHIKDIGQGFQRWETPWPVNDWEKTYGRAATMTTDFAVEALGNFPQDGTKPYFLFVHYQCTHDPYVKHSTWDFGDRDVDRYDSALAYCDDNMGRLIDTIDARADKEHTAVIVFSDHGELFGEHGLEHHGNSLYEPDIRTLLLARIPGATVKQVDERVSLTDLSPTVLDLVGAPADPKSQAWDLVPYVMRPTHEDPRDMYLYADMWHGAAHYQARGVLEGQYKYIRDIGTNAVQVFDIARDPDELSNLSDALPGVRSHLAEKLDAWEAYQLWHR